MCQMIFFISKNLEYHSSNLIYNAYVSIAATLGVFGLILLINYVYQHKIPTQNN